MLLKTSQPWQWTDLKAGGGISGAISTSSWESRKFNAVCTLYTVQLHTTSAFQLGQQPVAFANKTTVCKYKLQLNLLPLQYTTNLAHHNYLWSSSLGQTSSRKIDVLQIKTTLTQTPRHDAQLLFSATLQAISQFPISTQFNPFVVLILLQTIVCLGLKLLATFTLHVIRFNSYDEMLLIWPTLTRFYFSATTFLDPKLAQKLPF